ncbi:hypothetical protein FOT61_06470 [Serratia marcescens]|uniref:hypothetical protein n=1 Tax=Serratia marcescens TaxID=615 RepID=UPI0011CAEF79|nr:hypothetical protein [Serratia marcescens]TXE42502.1 hypothetical protein FOT61_06470 [Serratia marcescens]
MQILFCPGKGVKNRLEFSRGFFWMALKVLRGNSIIVTITENSASEDNILQGDAGVAVVVRSGEKIYVRDERQNSAPIS